MNEVEKQIINILKTANKPLMITDIASKLNLERHTTAKYLESLAGKGICEFSPKGKSKQWELTASPLLKLIEENNPVIDELKEILSKIDQTITVHDTKHNITFSSKETKEKCYEQHAGTDCECKDCPVNTGESAVHKHNNNKTTCDPIKDKTNKVISIVGITEEDKHARS